MRYVGIDIASERHVVAVVDGAGNVLSKAVAFEENATGYALLFSVIGSAGDALVAMEATGHYWKNLFAELCARGFPVALINPVRTRRFAAEDLQRTKTDAIDAVGIARFAAQKEPAVTHLPEQATEELRELVRHRDRLVQDFGDRVRQLHRLVDLGFPEFTQFVKELDSYLATALLRIYPTAQAFVGVRPKRLAKLKPDGVHYVGIELATAIVEAARVSVGKHHGPAYRIQVQHACEDIDMLRRRIRDLGGDIENRLAEHDVGKLLTTIDGIGPQTAAKLIAHLGNPAEFRSAGAIASFVGGGPGAQAVRKEGTHKRPAHAAGRRKAPRRPVDADAVRRPGCRRCPPSRTTPGYAPTTSACAPAASGRRWRWWRA